MMHSNKLLYCLAKITTFLSVLSFVEGTEFSCYFDICNTEDKQYCNTEEERCNFCGDYECNYGIKQCLNLCEKLMVTTNGKLLDQQYESSPHVWVIIIILFVSLLIIIFSLVYVYFTNKWCFKKAVPQNNSCVEVEPLNHSKDSISDNQKRPIFKKNKSGPVLDVNYNHNQASRVPNSLPTETFLQESKVHCKHHEKHRGQELENLTGEDTLLKQAFY